MRMGKITGVENASQAVEADSDCGTQSNYAAPPISACNAELHRFKLNRLIGMADNDRLQLRACIHQLLTYRSTNAGRTDEAEAGVTPQKDAPLCQSTQ